MKVYLVDGTYELFRHFYALPLSTNRFGEEVAATRGVLASMLSLLESGVTHVAIATDHVIESFRNDLWAPYKDGTGIDPRLRSQFELLEEALACAGFLVWPMVEYEADDAMAAGAAFCAADERVEQVILCTPDKDLAQCVNGNRIIQLDRRRKKQYTTDDVIAKFGVSPEFIPDYLALVGDSADGYPGLRGWGPKSAASALRRYGHIESIPSNILDVPMKSSDQHCASFATLREMALLFRRLATLVTESVLEATVDDLLWSGPGQRFRSVCDRLEAPDLFARAQRLCQNSPQSRFKRAAVSVSRADLQSRAKTPSREG